MDEGMTRRQKKHERTRRIMIDAAESEIMEKGFDNVTMDSISARALLSKATLYNYFDSKDMLFMAIRVRAYKQLTKEFQDVLDLELPPIENVKRLGRAFYQFGNKFPLYWQSMRQFREGGLPLSSTGAETIHGVGPIGENNVDEMAGGTERVPREIHEYREAVSDFLQVWVTAVARAITEGSIATDLSPRLVAIILAALTSGAIDQYQRRKGILDSMDVTEAVFMEHVLDILHKGLEHWGE
ncbi:TetR family transcriptional regulator [Candidatus Bathyarchaeota archaeon]|nr:TetR family transcriptional regulator [Candidatus Bathyarchaeota archaeon]